MNPDKREAIRDLISEIVSDPTAEVDVCGQFPEDTSTVQNFKQISEGQRLYSKEDLISVYQKAIEDVNKSAQNLDVELSEFEFSKSEDASEVTIGEFENWKEIDGQGAVRFSKQELSEVLGQLMNSGGGFF